MAAVLLPGLTSLYTTSPVSLETAAPAGVSLVTGLPGLWNRISYSTSGKINKGECHIRIRLTMHTLIASFLDLQQK